MLRLRALVPVLIGGALALLLVVYFFGSSGGKPNNDKPRCSSKDSLDAVKEEIFDRAQASRRGSDQTFAGLRSYSVLHAQSRLVRRLRSGSDRVTCKGRLLLDLPPGLTTVDGRPNVEADLEYDLSPGANGAPRLEALRHAEPLIAAIATVAPGSRVSSLPQPSAPEPRAPTPAPPSAPPSAPPGPIAVPPAESGVPSARPHPPKEQPKPKPIRGEASRPPSPSAPSAQSSPATPANPVRTTAPPVPVVSARPSFNCRFAHTRGEIAVCSDGGLANLDRQMAAQFFSALSHARPGQRAMLQRTRNQFLRYRDSCRTAGCIADAYRQRMREIADIMAGAW